MRYIKKIPITDPAVRDNYLSQNWRKLKEPRNLILTIFASVPLMFLCAAVCLFEIYILNPGLFSFLSNDSLSFTIRLDWLLLFIIAQIGYTFLHEMIHAVFIPGFRHSAKTYWGIRTGFGFVYTSEQLGKRRFILISVMPYILLSLVAAFVAAALGILNGMVAVILIINAAGSSVDFLNVLLVLMQVPKGGKVVSNGSETYYYTPTLANN